MTKKKDNIETNLELFRDLINRSNEAIFVNDPHTGLFIFVNDKACAGLGYDRNELLKMGVRDIEANFPNNFSWQAHVNELRQRGSTVLEGIHKRKDGTTFPNEANVSYVVLNGREFMVAVVRDITERKLAEEKLLLSKEEYRYLFNNNPLPMWIYDVETLNFLVVNEAALSHYGYSREAFLSMTLKDIRPPEDLPALLETVSSASQGLSSSGVWRHKKQDGTIIWVEIFSHGLLYEGRHARLVLSNDITKRKWQEQELIESERRYHALFDQSPDGIVLVNTEGKIIEFNESAHRELGYTREEFSQLQIADLDPVEGPEEVKTRLKKIVQAGRADFYVKHRTKQGELRDVHVIARIIMLSGKPVSHAILHDITDSKKAEEQLKSALREKETLLRELYHRTKNNMQVIMSLINLQIAAGCNGQDVYLLNDTKNRIMSMALVHEKLYGSRDLSNVDLKNYIDDLATALLRSYRVDTNKIVKTIEIDDMELSIDTIMPIGLIINELMSNTLKYAFPGDRHGEIRIAARFTDEAEIELTYGDNGIGFPAGFDLRNTHSLGLQLVNNMVKGQLLGRLTLNTDEGSEFLIRFKEPSRKKRI